MKILLIYPTTMSNNQPDKFRKAFMPPLNLAILDKLTHMANPSHEVTVINDVVEEIDFNAVNLPAAFSYVLFTALNSIAG